MAKKKKVKNKQVVVSLGPVKVCFITKEDLKKENVKLTNKLQRLKQQYSNVYDVIQRLTQNYQEAKSSFPPWRYRLLKNMIKRSTTDDAIQSTCSPDFAEVDATGTAGGSPNNLWNNIKEFREITRAIAVLEAMSKQDLEHDNKQKEEKISNYINKFQRAHDRLVQLRKDYRASKQRFILKRYWLMKRMIKTVTRDEELEP